MRIGVSKYFSGVIPGCRHTQGVKVGKTMTVFQESSKNDSNIP